jgi:phosphohistidine phosphatase
MRRLMLLRHAKTESDAPSGKDFDRRLDDRGRADAENIGNWIAHQPHLPDRALVSTAVRARETWDIVWKSVSNAAPHMKVDHLPDLYGAEPAHLLAVIRAVEIQDPKGLMIVGHNPGLHEIALALVNSGDPAACAALADNLPTSGLAVIAFATETWNDVSFRRGQLELFISPKLLKTA